jgi:hypothetical protein
MSKVKRNTHGRVKKRSVREGLFAQEQLSRNLLRDAKPQDKKFFSHLFRRKPKPKPKIGSQKKPIPSDAINLPPPAPFSNWMECALFNTDIGSLHNDLIWEQSYSWEISRSDMEKAILNEYLTLCATAGIELSEDTLARLKKRFYD